MFWDICVIQFNPGTVQLTPNAQENQLKAQKILGTSDPTASREQTPRRQLGTGNF